MEGGREGDEERKVDLCFRENRRKRKQGGKEKKIIVKS